jgi:hypothetical protein
MANEVRVNASLAINKPTANQNYQALPSAFRADMTGSKGPLPGAVTIPVIGADIDLSGLTSLGGFCRIMNIDTVNYVTYGIKDTGTNTFYPLGEMQPGETFIIRLSRKLGKDEVGTGTFSGSTAHLHMKADTGPCVVKVEAFDP